MKTENYSQANNFVWFIGVVEDINDPLEMGRVKVRCFGFHSASKTQIKTEDLPWANVMTPVTSAAMSEIGQSATGLLQGSWVVGFFRDGTGAQDPLIMGSLPSMHTEKVNSSPYGFSDPDGIYPIESKLNASDLPDEARSEYQNSFSYTKKTELRTNNSPIAIANVDRTWNFPNISDQIKPVYPKNHVTSFEHDSNIIEYDSSSPNNRYSHLHKSGTHREIDKDGNEMEVIVGDKFQVIRKGSHVRIKGVCDLTIDEGCNTKITGDWNIEVQGNKYENIYGNSKVYVQNNFTETVGKDVAETYSGKQTTKVTGNIDIDGARIDLN